MKLMGFNFDKISIEKFISHYENLKINTKLDLINISKVKTDFFKPKEDLIAINFAFGLDYEPKIAQIEFIGSILLSIESKLAKEVLKQWEEKQIPEDFRISIFNIILKKATLRALRLEEEMNLPLHVPLPTLKKDQETKA